MKGNILILKQNLLKLCDKYKIIILILLILGVCFYWYEWLPSKIKKECSFVPYHVDGITELTQETIDRQKIDFDNCVNDHPTIIENFKSFYFEKIDSGCSSMPRGYGEVPRRASPPRTDYRKASQREYDFCLHSRGL